MDSTATRKECAQAEKILTQYERLADKLGVSLSAARIAELNRKRDSGTITQYDVPATLRRTFPSGFESKSLDEIRAECRRART